MNKRGIIKSIHLDTIGSISLDDSIHLINTDDVWGLGFTGEGVSLNKEIDVLRHAVYELSQELCTHDSTYSWC